MSTPPWVRALQTIDRGAYFLYRVHEIVRDELLFGFLDPRVRPELTDAAYAGLETYLPGGARFESGLFGWEEQALATPPFPRSGRVLLGAAGGGRELRVLAERGFEVVAFEPNERLFAGATEVARSHERVVVHRATYADLVRAADHGDGPLATLRDGGRFDAVILGWGSITHVLEPSEHRRLLSAIRRLAPRAPMLASFYTRSPVTPPSRTQRARSLIRSALRLVGGNATHGDELCYATAGGFAYSFTEGEIAALAHTTGYDVASFADEPFGHVVLIPKPDADAAVNART